MPMKGAPRVRRKLECRWAVIPGQSGEAHIFLIQDYSLTAEVPLRRSILQSTLRQKYRSTDKHNPQRDGGPEKGLYRLHPIALQKTSTIRSNIITSITERCPLTLKSLSVTIP